MIRNGIFYSAGLLSISMWGYAVADSTVQTGNINNQNENAIEEIFQDSKQKFQKSIGKQNGALKFPRHANNDYETLANDETEFNLKSIDVVYIYANPTTVVDDIIRKKLQTVKDRDIKVKDLISLIQDTETEIALAGYPMTRIVLPAQDTPEENAIIKLNVVSGYVANVKMKIKMSGGASNPNAYKTRIKKLINYKLGNLEGTSYINSKEMGKKLDNLKKYYGLSVDMFLSRGEEMRAYNVHIAVNIAPEYHIFSVNNGLSYNLDQWLANYTYIKNDFKDWRSSQLMTSVSTSMKNDKDNYYRNVKTDYSYFDDDRIKNIYSATMFRTATKLKRTAFRSTSNGHTISYKRTYPWIETDEKVANLTGGIIYDINRARNKNTSQYLYHDKITFAMVGANMEQGDHQFNISLRRDIGLGERKVQTKHGIPASAQGVKPRTKITNIDYNYKMPLEGETFREYKLSFSTQRTGGKAVLSRQKFLGDGILSRVRGFKHTNLTGDEGYVATNTFNMKPMQFEEYAIVPYVAFAFADVRRAKPTATERKNAKGRSLTLGVKTAIKGYQFNGGFSKAKKKDYKNISSTRFLFSISKPLNKKFEDPEPKDE